MLVTLFSFPLPNNGDRYDLSANELVKLLQSAYNEGFKQGKESTNTETLTVASNEIEIGNSEWR